MAKARQHFDAIVVGAGAIGASCALALARARPEARIAILERNAPAQPTAGENRRVWALGAAAVDFLDQVNVTAQLDQFSCYPYRHMVVWDENSDGELVFNAEEFAKPALGWMVDADQCTVIAQTLLQEQSNLQAKFTCSIKSLDWIKSKPCLQLHDETLSADLVIAADGANSWLRRQLRILAPTKRYRQRGVVAKIRTDAAHGDTAWQRFLRTGPVAVLPLADNFSSIVWSTTEPHAEKLLQSSKAEFEQELAAALQHRLGDVSLCSDRLAFPLQSRQAERYFSKRIVLVGDAAHSIHPLAGQGANLGFRDARALVDILQASDGFGATSDLARYQRLRRPDNLQTDFMMSSLHLAYQLDWPVWSLLRGRGMNYLSNSKTIKSWLGRQAMGL